MFSLIGAASSDPDTPYIKAQRLVDIGGGRRINVYCTGTGAPTVVLDAAIGSSMDVWHKVQPALAMHQRVCSFDRAGYGFSDPAPTARTTSANVADLHRLLERARILEPYVIVAHSLNAFDARLFADRYRRSVAGIVLVEPSEVEEDQFAAIYGRKKYAAELAGNLTFVRACAAKADRHRLRPGDDCVGPLDPHVSRALSAVRMRHATAPPMWDAISSEMSNLPNDVRDVSLEQRDYGNLPLIVLSAMPSIASPRQPGETAAQAAQAQRLWTRLRNADAARSHRGVNCTIAGTGHYVQLDRPAAVIAAVREVTADATLGAAPSCRRVGSRLIP